MRRGEAARYVWVTLGRRFLAGDGRSSRRRADARCRGPWMVMVPWRGAPLPEIVLVTIRLPWSKKVAWASSRVDAVPCWARIRVWASDRVGVGRVRGRRRGTRCRSGSAVLTEALMVAGPAAVPRSQRCAPEGTAAPLATGTVPAASENIDPDDAVTVADRLVAGDGERPDQRADRSPRRWPAARQRRRWAPAAARGAPPRSTSATMPLTALKSGLPVRST